MSFDNFIAFVKERHAIYVRRYSGQSKPWTNDPILQQYRFCNVFRELDTVTEWIAANWRTPHATDPDLWFAMVVARLVNWPETLEPLTTVLFSKGQVSWYPKQFVRILHDRKKHGEKVYTGAYMMRCDAMTDGEDKADYLANAVLTPLWNARRAMRIDLKIQKNFTWSAWHGKLTQFHGIGSFLAAQVVADIKYAWPYREVADWWTFAASGPGSRRGLNCVLGRPVDSPWREKDWRRELVPVYEATRAYMGEVCEPPMHAQDVQNCLCEYFKYCKIQDGSGRMRSKYPGV